MGLTNRIFRTNKQLEAEPAPELKLIFKFKPKMAPRKLSGSGKRELCSSDPHYVEKRAKNNDAVKKSREKTRMKAKETMEKVSILKQENEMLEERIKLLHKELVFLKDIFFAHASSKHGLTDVDM